VQRGSLKASEFGKLFSKSNEFFRQSATTRSRTRPAQQRQFERLDRVSERAPRAAQPQQRMFQQRQQRRRLQLL
jgi:hypothetical protein